MKRVEQYFDMWYRRNSSKKQQCPIIPYTLIRNNATDENQLSCLGLLQYNKSGMLWVCHANPGMLWVCHAKSGILWVCPSSLGMVWICHGSYCYLISTGSIPRSGPLTTWRVLEKKMDILRGKRGSCVLAILSVKTTLWERTSPLQLQNNNSTSSADMPIKVVLQKTKSLTNTLFTPHAFCLLALLNTTCSTKAFHID